MWSFWLIVRVVVHGGWLSTRLICMGVLLGAEEGGGGGKEITQVVILILALSEAKHAFTT